MLKVYETIKTTRLVLRPLQPSDCETLVDELNNFNITRNTGRVPFPYNNQDAFDYLKFVRELDLRSQIRAIVLQSHPNSLIGVIGYLYSANKNDAELGYWLSESQWGKGLVSEAAYAMVQHAFDVSGHRKLIACYQNENPASGRVLVKLGFHEVGQSHNFSLARNAEVLVTNMELIKKPL